MDLVIRGTGILSAAGDNSKEDFLAAPSQYNTDRLLAKEPDYTPYIKPMQLRRMGKAVRMGIGASVLALKNAGVEKADAISVGTALGCLHDTEVFLSKLVEQNEQMLTPTSFIQSTHNTVAGQIALLTGCYGHNLTYVHRGHSFEHAILNAQLYLNDHPGENMLVGGIEELTETSIAVLKRAGVYREEASTPESILNDSKKGSPAGEGASFLLISDKASGTRELRIKDIATFISREEGKALDEVRQFLSRNGTEAKELDFVMLGINGDSRSTPFYQSLRENLFKDVSQGAFKHLCGEYPVASSFAVGVLGSAIRKGLPATTLLNKEPRKLNRILLVNNFMHHYSCWLFEAE
jgi:3-oxoacyl-[acyl-carrier-protein] synthase II